MLRNVFCKLFCHLLRRPLQEVARAVSDTSTKYPRVRIFCHFWQLEKYPDTFAKGSVKKVSGSHPVSDSYFTQGVQGGELQVAIKRTLSEQFTFWTGRLVGDGRWHLHNRQCVGIGAHCVGIEYFKGLGYCKGLNSWIDRSFDYWLKDPRVRSPNFEDPIQLYLRFRFDSETCLNYPFLSFFLVV